MLKGQITRLLDRIKNWYRGECIQPPPNDRSSALIFFGLDTYKKSRSAAAATVLVEFWVKHWQWTIGFVVATLGLLHLIK